MNKDRIKELESKINIARNDYYNHQPKVSDKIFDAWVDELRLLDPNNKAVVAVGSPIVQSEWKKAKHQISMGSLDKVNSPNELNDWSKNKGCKEWFVCEKLDGLSIELIYENGKFIDGITRGDGKIGESIGVNVIRMAGVHPKLKNNFTGSLRGEIIMLNSVWKKDFSDKANPRNAASGVSKRLDGVDVDKLNVILYQVLGDIDFKSELDQFKWLENNKFQVPNYWAFKSIDDVNKHWRKYQDKDRAKLDYDIDGLVVRIADLTLQESFGDKDLRPLGAIAFKFDNETRESIIRDIVWQTGSSGRITPVAIVDPVQLVGATITRASLYNIAYIHELQLDIGATVLVARANDVIPRIEELVKGTGNVIAAPLFCPECNGRTKMDGENLMCTNTKDCRAQIIGRLSNWVNELNLLEWGSSLLEKLVDSKKALTVADLYKLSVKDLASLDRLGDKSAQKCYDILWANNEIPLEVFLGGLSIPMIGQSTIKAIMNDGCDTLTKFGQLNSEAFEKVQGVGPTKAKSLADGLKNNQQLILDLLKNGVKIKDRVVGKLSGQKIVFTGAMENKRSVLEKMAADAGAEVKSSVSKGVTLLVIEDVNSTSSKAQSAKKLGTRLVSEKDFIQMVR